VHTAEDLTAVAAERNNRPRKILGWDTSAQRFIR
jgi:IS30 family transposase